MHDLPDLHDGLTPVQRKILEALARKSKPGRRPTLSSQSVVKVVVGGQVPSLEADRVYLELVQMAQPFRTRYPLVDGVGNFGTLDGDPPADAVFTKCGLSPFGAEALAGRVPALLVNGRLPIEDTEDAAFLPHHLGEVLDAARALVEDPGLADDALLAVVPGPDFPTGGVVSRADAGAVERTGEGAVRVRARISIASDASRPALVVTEIPFLSRKVDLIAKLASGVRSGSLRAFADVSDDSDRNGIRITLTLRPGVAPSRALDELAAQTCMHRTLRVDMRTRSDDEASRQSLPALLRAYVRRTQAVVADLDRLAATFGDARRTHLD
jgi:DNA gyrase subunit A